MNNDKLMNKPYLYRPVPAEFLLSEYEILVQPDEFVYIVDDDQNTLNSRFVNICTIDNKYLGMIRRESLSPIS